MMGDAGDEAGLFLLFWDNRSYDTANIGAECRKFVHRIDWLFVRGNCMNLGYSKFMLGFLSQVRLLKFGDKEKAIGSPTPLHADMIDRCLGRLRCWVSLAVQVVQAEFPSWEILQSFSIFTLAPL